MTPPRGATLNNTLLCTILQTLMLGPQTGTSTWSPSQSPLSNAIFGRVSLERSALLRAAMFRPKRVSAYTTRIKASRRRSC